MSGRIAYEAYCAALGIKGADGFDNLNTKMQLGWQAAYARSVGAWEEETDAAFLSAEIAEDADQRAYNSRCEALAAAARIGAEHSGRPSAPVESPHVTLTRAALFEAYLIGGAV